MLLFAVAVLGATGCSEGRTIVCPAVYPVSLVVSPASYTIPVGGTAAYSATISGSLGGPCGTGEPRPAVHKVTWSLSNGSVAAVTSSTDTTLVLTTVSDGASMVIATWVDDTNVKSAGMLTVVRLAPASGRAP